MTAPASGHVLRVALTADDEQLIAAALGALWAGAPHSRPAIDELCRRTGLMVEVDAHDVDDVDDEDAS